MLLFLTFCTSDSRKIDRSILHVLSFCSICSVIDLTCHEWLSLSHLSVCIPLPFSMVFFLFSLQKTSPSSRLEVPKIKYKSVESQFFPFDSPTTRSKLSKIASRRWTLNVFKRLTWMQFFCLGDSANLGFIDPYY